jgi:hypothetical protein
VRGNVNGGSRLDGRVPGEVSFEDRINQRVRGDVNRGDRVDGCLCDEVNTNETIVTIERRVRSVNGDWREHRGLESPPFLQRQFAAATFAVVAWSHRFRLAFVAAHNTLPGRSP